MNQIELEHVDKHYGAYHALKDINVAIPKGQFVALVGPSGCGKSTLLRSIAGLESITGGELRIAGERMNNVPPRKRDLAMVFQSYALYPHKTVRENLVYALRLKRVPKAEANKAADEVARITGLDKLMDRYPRELSGGQRQRVAMGRAIIRDPGVPVRRSAVEPRRRAPPPHAIRGAQAPRPAGGYLGLRHLRPDRGDDDGGSRRRPAR